MIGPYNRREFIAYVSMTVLWILFFILHGTDMVGAGKDPSVMGGFIVASILLLLNLGYYLLWPKIFDDQPPYITLVIPELIISFGLIYRLASNNIDIAHFTYSDEGSVSEFPMLISFFAVIILLGGTVLNLYGHFADADWPRGAGRVLKWIGMGLILFSLIWQLGAYIYVNFALITAGPGKSGAMPLLLIFRYVVEMFCPLTFILARMVQGREQQIDG